MTIFGNRVFKELIKFNVVIRVGPDPIGLVFLQEKESKTQTGREGTLREKEGSCEQAEDGDTEEPMLRHLDLKLVVSRTVGKGSSVVLATRAAVFGDGGPSRPVQVATTGRAVLEAGLEQCTRQRPCSREATFQPGETGDPLNAWGAKW